MLNDFRNVIVRLSVESNLPVYIIGVDKNSGQEKGQPNSDQTFQPHFKELLFISIGLELIEIQSNSHPDHSCLLRCCRSIANCTCTGQTSHQTVCSLDCCDSNFLDDWCRCLLNESCGLTVPPVALWVPKRAIFGWSNPLLTRGRRGGDNIK